MKPELYHVTGVFRSLDLIHPAARSQYVALEQNLSRAFENKQTRYHFRVFETYRTPQRQNWLITTGSTKAKAFSSAHQFGLAVDFVPIDDNEQWTWNADEADWRILDQEAAKVGLLRPISWDRPHIEHPLFAKVQDVVRFR